MCLKKKTVFMNYFTRWGKGAVHKEGPTFRGFRKFGHTLGKIFYEKFSMKICWESILLIHLCFLSKILPDSVNKFLLMQRIKLYFSVFVWFKQLEKSLRYDSCHIYTTRLLIFLITCLKTGVTICSFFPGTVTDFCPKKVQNVLDCGKVQQLIET